METLRLSLCYSHVALIIIGSLAVGIAGAWLIEEVINYLKEKDKEYTDHE